MTMPTGPAALLRIYSHEGAREGHHPLFEAVISAAREAKLAGATVLRGPLGFGRSARVHNVGLVELPADMPLVIEIVDTEAKLRAFLPTLSAMPAMGLVTLEKVEVVHGVNGAGD